MFQSGSTPASCDVAAAPAEAGEHMPVQASVVDAGRLVRVMTPLRGMLQRLAGMALRAGRKQPLAPQESPRPEPRLVPHEGGAALVTPDPELLPLDEVQRIRMLRALGRLLDQHPAARSLFPALALVEIELRSAGAIDLLPTDVVRDASTLLVQLASDHSDDGLALLRGRLRRLRAAQCLAPQ